MKKLFFLLCTTLTISTYANTINKSIKVNISNMDATSDEIVYRSNGKKLSHLFWKLPDVKLLGISGSLQLSNQVIINADLKKNISNPNSTMEDFDWLNENRSDWTHRSIHPDTQIKEVTKFDINLQFGMAPTKVGIVYGLVGYKRDTLKWVAKDDGSYTYTTPDNTACVDNSNIACTYNNNFRDNEFTSSSGEKGISYEQLIQANYIGLGLVNSNIKNIKFDVNIKYSPFVFIDDKDTHHQRTGTVNGEKYDGLLFEGFMEDARLLEYSINLAYELTKKASIYFSYINTDISVAKGYIKTTYLGTNYTAKSSDGTAGAAHESELYSLGIKYDF